MQRLPRQTCVAPKQSTSLTHSTQVFNRRSHTNPADEQSRDEAQRVGAELQPVIAPKTRSMTAIRERDMAQGPPGSDRIPGRHSEPMQTSTPGQSASTTQSTHVPKNGEHTWAIAEHSRSLAHGVGAATHDPESHSSFSSQSMSATQSTQ